MRRVFLIGALLAFSAPAAPVSGQKVINRLYTGCGQWSCFRLSYTLQPFVGGPNAFVDAVGFFFAPNDLGGFPLAFINRYEPIYGTGGPYLFSDYGIADYTQRPGKLWTLTVSYGPEGTSWFDGTEHSQETLILTATPEPATMIMLATGLLGMAGVARRRRRLTTRGPTSEFDITDT